MRTTHKESIQQLDENGRPPRKRQADRLLKHLPLSDRKRQQQIRQQISRDLQFISI
jgi:hypothetical protein